MCFFFLRQFSRCVNVYDYIPEKLISQRSAMLTAVNSKFLLVQSDSRRLCSEMCGVRESTAGRHRTPQTGNTVQFKEQTSFISQAGVLRYLSSFSLNTSEVIPSQIQMAACLVLQRDLTDAKQSLMDKYPYNADISLFVFSLAS